MATSVIGTMSTVTNVMHAEIILLRDGTLNEETKKDNLKKMIESEVRYHTRRSVTVTFSSIPSKFLYSSNAIKMRASMHGASGVLSEKLIELFGQPGLKVSRIDRIVWTTWIEGEDIAS